MTEQEAKVAKAQVDVRIREVQLQERKELLQLGIAEANAARDAKVATLTRQWKEAQLDLEYAKVRLTEAETVIGSGPD